MYVPESKFLLFGVRASDMRNARVLLDVSYLPPEKGYGGEAGAAHTEPCPVRRLIRRRNLGSDMCRWYQELELSCGRTRLVRLDSTEEDQRTGRNRAERIHQHAPDSQVYKDSYGWREEAESWNNSFDRTLCGRRMIAHTHQRQLLFMLGHMLARNVLAGHALNCERLRSTA